MSNSGPLSSVVCSVQGLDLLPPADTFSCYSRDHHEGQFLQSSLRVKLPVEGQEESRVPMDCTCEAGI